MRLNLLNIYKKIGSRIVLLLFLFYFSNLHINTMKPVFVTVEQLNETIQMPNNFEEAENEVDELKEHEIKENEKEPKSLYAKSAVLVDAVSKRVLFEKNCYEKMPIASTTKIMTCIYVLENGDLDQLVTISSNACNQPKVRLGMKEGEQYVLRDLLYALMLESYNDCAVAIAEHMSGDVDLFCEEMTNKARDIGAYDTNFVTPNGLDAKEHYSTSYDLALITCYALNNPQFLEIINTPTYEFYEKTKGNKKTVYNRDAFLTQYEGAIGVKTGFTSNAGYCFVGAAKREDRTLVSVALASGWPPNKNYKWEDTKKLMNYGFDEYRNITIDQEQITLPNIPVKNKIKSEYAELYISFNENLLIREDEQIVYKLNLSNQLNAPVKKDQKIGSVSIYLDSKYYKDIPIYSNKDVDKVNYKDCFEVILLKFLIE